MWPPFDPGRQAWPGGASHIEAEMLARGHAGRPDGLTDFEMYAKAEDTWQRANWLSRCQGALSSAEDPIAKLVIAVASATYLPRFGSYITTDWDAVYELCPELGLSRTSGDRSPNHAPWDHDQIQAWFLGHRVSPAQEARCCQDRLVLGSTPQVYGMVV